MIFHLQVFSISAFLLKKLTNLNDILRHLIKRKLDKVDIVIYIKKIEIIEHEVLE